MAIQIPDDVRGPFTDAGDGAWRCEILFRGEWVPFVASADDPEEYGRVIHAYIEDQQ